MKIMKLIYLVALLFVVSATQQAFCARGGNEPVSLSQRVEATTVVEQGIGTLAATYVESDFIIAAAADHIKAAHELLFSKDTTVADDIKNTNAIIVQSQIIILAQQKFEKTQDVVAKKIETEVAPEGYWARFVAGVKNVGSGIANFFAPGKGTDEEKTIAGLMVKILTEQEVKIAEKFALLQQDLNEAEKIALKQRYDVVVKQIEAAIYEQQAIIGDVKSGMIKRGLLLGAAAAGTAATGMFVKDKYFAEDESIMSRIKTAAEKTDVQKAIVEGRAERQAPTVGDIKSAFTDPEIRKDISQRSQELFDSGKKKVGEVYESVTTVDPNVKARLDAEGEDTEGLTLKDLQDYKKALEVDPEVAKRLDKENENLEIFTGEDFASAVKNVKERLVGLGNAAQETDVTKAILEGQKQKQEAPTLDQSVAVLKDYFTSPGAPAQEEEDVEGITFKDLKNLRDSEAVQSTLEKAKDYGTQAKDYISDQYEKVKNDLKLPSEEATQAMLKDQDTMLVSDKESDQEDDQEENDQEVTDLETGEEDNLETVVETEPKQLEEDIEAAKEVTEESIIE